MKILVSNDDDHLRNHGFLLTPQGWRLAPAYDLNPIPYGHGLRLNISETSNELDLGLARSVAPHFRLKPDQATAIITEVLTAVRTWPQEAETYQLNREEQQRMGRAFAVAALSV